MTDTPNSLKPNLAETTGPDVSIVETEDAVERRAKEAYFTASQGQLIWARFKKQKAAMVGAGVKSAYVCGGGARNIDLMRRLHRRLSGDGVHLGVTDDLGLAAEWVEAAAWAWLAARTLAGRPGNETCVTGAEGPRILGGIYPA